MTFSDNDDGPAASRHQPLHTSATCVAIALVLLPLALGLPVQLDHSLQLLILPSWWIIGRHQLQPGASRPWERWLLFAFAAMTMVSVASSEHSARAAVAAAALWWTIAAAITARKLSGSAQAILIILAGMTGGAVLGVIFGRISLLMGAPHIPLYTHPRIFGLHMLPGAIAALGLVMWGAGSRLTRVVIWSAALIVWTGLAWSGSRAPALGLACALLAWTLCADSAERKRLLLCVITLTAAALVTSRMLGPHFGEGWWTALSRTAKAGSDLNALSSTRSEFWHVVGQAIMQSPWIGHGGDAYLFMRPRQVGNQPHNFILQWLLEYGVLGGLTLILLLGRTLIVGAVASCVPGRKTIPVRIAWSGFLGSAVCAMFDGVFYHVIVALPVAVLAGLCIGGDQQIGTSTVRRAFSALHFWLLTAGTALILHNIIATALVRARPESPREPLPQLLRLFPSETFGLWNWLNTWQTTNPSSALEWAQWAQKHSTNPAWFHLYAAQCHLRAGKIDQARFEVNEGLNSAASQLERAELQRMKEVVSPRQSHSGH